MYTMKTIFKKINLNTDWQKISLGKVNDFYIFAQRGKKDSKSDTIPKDSVVKIIFEVGIDSFSKKRPLTVNYITLNFNDISSSDEATNKITALLKVLHYPSKFYIRPIEIVDTQNTLKTEGKTSIRVGINALKLN